MDKDKHTHNGIIEYCASITQGLEDLAIEELLHVDPEVDLIAVSAGTGSWHQKYILQKHWNRKRNSACSLIRFNSQVKPKRFVDRLRLIDGLYLFVGFLEHTPTDLGEAQQRFHELFTCDATTARRSRDAIFTWKEFMADKLQSPDDIAFRASCVRDGAQNYKSPDLAAAVGDKFVKGLKANSSDYGTKDRGALPVFHVSLKQYSLEIIAFANKDQTTVGLTVTDYEETAKKHRPPVKVSNEVAHTSLRADIIAAIVQLAKLQYGDIVYDPMCGTSAIPMEALLAGSLQSRASNDSSVSFVNPSASGSAPHISPVFALSSENNMERVTHTTDIMFEKCMERFRVAPPLGCFVGDVTRLPIRSGCIDCILCDPPYGKRCGSRNSTGELLNRFTEELARILRPSSGRAVILHAWKRYFSSFIEDTPYFERYLDDRPVDNNKIQCFLFFLKRTDRAYEPKRSVNDTSKRRRKLGSQEATTSS
eukprot:gb/GECG01016271.1/.p1 GENE.gb/GECG01016271.1/~~gb/GECG01016271.1/.p1  ORF type:complete len:479 (+),score=52.72 gb/GECG01016271.1/:1-1437(+)